MVIRRGAQQIDMFFGELKSSLRGWFPFSELALANSRMKFGAEANALLLPRLSTVLGFNPSAGAGVAV